MKSVATIGRAAAVVMVLTSGLRAVAEPPPPRGLIHCQFDIVDKFFYLDGQVEVPKASYNLVDAVAATLRGNPQLHVIEVVGHADDRGDDARNRELGLRRAEGLRAALLERGIEADRLTVRTVGRTHPVETGHDAKSRARNRFVEFHIHSRCGDAGCADVHPTNFSIEPVIAFSRGDASPLGEFRSTLEDFALHEIPGETLYRIDGYADDDGGDDARGRALALARATAIEHVLVELGFPAKRLTTLAHGRAERRCFERDDRCRTMNRVVTVTVDWDMDRRKAARAK